MARKWRHSKRRYKSGAKKATVKKVHQIVEKKLNKTKELIKLVSFMTDRPIRSINADDPWTDTVIYSLTGGRMGAGTVLAQGAEQPTESSLFSLRPAQGSSTLLAGDGGQVDDNSNVAQNSLTTQGVHVLRGRSCYLKNWYCNIRINNQGHVRFTTQSGDEVPAEQPQNSIAQGIRILIVETRRPLGQQDQAVPYKDNLARQLFLQFHSGAGTGTVAPPGIDITSDAILGFLNLEVIKRVHYDKFFWLGSGDVANFNSQKILRLKIPLNKKAYFNFQYNIEDATSSPYLSYQGPFIYMVALGSSDASQSLDVAPRMDIASILTLEDD